MTQQRSGVRSISAGSLPEPVVTVSHKRTLEEEVEAPEEEFVTEEAWERRHGCGFAASGVGHRVEFIDVAGFGTVAGVRVAKGEAGVFRLKSRMRMGIDKHTLIDSGTDTIDQDQSHDAFAHLSKRIHRTDRGMAQAEVRAALDNARGSGVSSQGLTNSSVDLTLLSDSVFERTDSALLALTGPTIPPPSTTTGSQQKSNDAVSVGDSSPLRLSEGSPCGKRAREHASRGRGVHGGGRWGPRKKRCDLKRQAAKRTARSHTVESPPHKSLRFVRGTHGVVYKGQRDDCVSGEVG